MELHGHTSQRSQKRNARKQSKKRYTVLKRNGIYPVDFLTHVGVNIEYDHSKTTWLKMK